MHLFLLYFIFLIFFYFYISFDNFHHLHSSSSSSSFIIHLHQQTETHPVYRYLKTASDREQIDWNFAKYLVSRSGVVRFASLLFFLYFTYKNTSDTLKVV
jgi:hypothetical protein